MKCWLAGVVAPAFPDLVRRWARAPSTTPTPPSAADPDTKAWLECSTHPVFGFPDVVRFSWATCAPLLEAARAVRVQWECEAEDDPAQLRLSFVRDVRPASKPAPPRHPFYRARRLTRVYDAFLGPPVAT